MHRVDLETVMVDTGSENQASGGAPRGAGEPMTIRALSVKQPYAESIASGAKRVEFRTWQARALVGSDLLICSSRTPAAGYDGELLGVAVCIVRLARISGSEGAYRWHLESPRRVAPVAVRGSAAIFTVDRSILRIVTEAPAASSARPVRPAGRSVPALIFADGSPMTPENGLGDWSDDDDDDE